MTIDTLTEQGITVIAVQGRLDAPAAPEAERAFVAAVDEGARRVLLDLNGVDYMSSGGIRVIVMLSKRLGREGGSLKLCGMNPFVSEVFEITNLASQYDIRSDRHAGLAAFLSEGE